MYDILCLFFLLVFFCALRLHIVSKYQINFRLESNVEFVLLLSDCILVVFVVVVVGDLRIHTGKVFLVHRSQ